MKNRLNGDMFSAMVVNGYKNLLRVEAKVNAMNVFPVADGDTGTNMRLTLEHGIKSAKKNKHLGQYLSELSRGMLLGARGNSGVILSQLFKGMSQSLLRDSIASPGEIKDALISGYKTAYNAVLQPVEGTVLTVAREGIENIKGQIYSGTKISNMFSMYLAEMKKSLSNTPNLLPTLKDAGVVDSGAYGYITIVDGMVKYLYGDIVSDIDIPQEALPEVAATIESEDLLFDENSIFTDGYCMEFLLQLMNSKHYREVFNIDTFSAALKPLGSSIVAIQEGSVVKVHIHTFSPSPIITLAQAFGEFISFKLENMTIQHKESDLKKQAGPKKKFGVIAVVDGDGLEKLYKELGADIILRCEKTMNTSVGEFKNAILELNAETTVILPNNPNVIEAAKQAAAMIEDKNVCILPTNNTIEGYFTLSMDIGDSDDSEYRIKMMREGTDGVDIVSVFTAVKDYSSNGFSCFAGDKVGTINGKTVASGSNSTEALINAIDKLEDLDERGSLVVFLGKDASQSEDDIYDALAKNFEEKEIQILYGGQPLYELTVAVL